jgi:hypothetical protein
MAYDPEQPDADAWNMLDVAGRRAVMEDWHEGRVDALHPGSLHRSMHVGLHVTVETLVAAGEPHVVRTIDRITEQGVRRHAALHMVMEVLARRMAALAGAEPWSDEQWAAALERLDPADWIGRRMARDLGPPDQG